MAGGLRSVVQLTVLDMVAVLPHPSLAVNVLVCEAVQPVVLIKPSADEIVGVPQASVAVALASAVFIAPAVGLHPNVTLL